MFLICCGPGEIPVGQPKKEIILLLIIIVHTAVVSVMSIVFKILTAVEYITYYFRVLNSCSKGLGTRHLDTERASDLKTSSREDYYALAI